MMMDHESWGPTLLRLTLGLLFIIPGLSKLMGPAGIIGVLDQIGFPGPTFWAWVLIISEIVFGVAVLAGYKLRYTVWPLALILVVATLTVQIPAMKGNPMGIVNVLFHLVALTGLISLSLSGPGRYSVSTE